MTLKSFYGKRVTVVCDNEQTFRGVVDDYFFPEDNENGEESIILKTSDYEFIEFTSSEINEIKLS